MAEKVKESFGMLPENLQVSLPIEKSLLGIAVNFEQNRYQAHEALAERVTQMERKVCNLQKLHGDDRDCTFSARGVSEISLFLKAVGEGGSVPERVLDAMRDLIAELDTASSSVEEKVAAIAVISACHLTEINADLQNTIAKQARLIQAFTTEMSEQNSSLREENGSLHTKVNNLSEQMNVLSELMASRLPALQKVTKQLLPISTKNGELFDLSVPKGASFRSASSKDQRSSSRTGSNTPTEANGSGNAANGTAKEEVASEQHGNGAAVIQAEDVRNDHIARIEEYVKSMDLPPAVDVERDQAVSWNTAKSTTINTSSAAATNGRATPSADSSTGKLFVSSSRKAGKRISFGGEPDEYNPSEAETTPISSQGAKSVPKISLLADAALSEKAEAGERKQAPAFAVAVNPASTKPTASLSSDSTPVKQASTFKVDAPTFQPAAAARPAITLSSPAKTPASQSAPARNYVADTAPPASPAQIQTTAAVEAAAAPRQLASPVSSPIRDITARATNVSAPAGVPAGFMDRLPASQRARFAQVLAGRKGPN